MIELFENIKDNFTSIYIIRERTLGFLYANKTSTPIIRLLKNYFTFINSALGSPFINLAIFIKTIWTYFIYRINLYLLFAKTSSMYNTFMHVNKISFLPNDYSQQITITPQGGSL